MQMGISVSVISSYNQHKFFLTLFLFKPNTVIWWH